MTYAYVACLRSIGIPCRSVSAYGMGDSGCHTWAEVYLPGADWFGVDVDSASIAIHSRCPLPTFGDSKWLRFWVAVGRGNSYSFYGQKFDRVDFVNGFGRGGYCGAAPESNSPRKRNTGQWTQVDEITG